MIAESATQEQRRLVAFYLERLGHEGPAELVDFSFAQMDPTKASTVRVARLRLPCDDGSELCFTGSLAEVSTAVSERSDHRHLFIGTYDSSTLSLSELVAAAHHYDHAVETLGYGHTFPLGDASPLRQGGYVAALVLEASIYRFFEDVADVLYAVPTSLFSILPISAAELALKVDRGLDALLDLWEQSRKDILHVNAEVMV